MNSDQWNAPPGSLRSDEEFAAQVVPPSSRGESRSPRTSWASRASRPQGHQKLSPPQKVDLRLFACGTQPLPIGCSSGRPAKVFRGGRPEGFSVRPCRQVWTKSPTQPATPPCIHLRPNTLLVSPNPATLATRFSPACCRSATMMWKRFAVCDPRHTHVEKGISASSHGHFALFSAVPVFFVILSAASQRVFPEIVPSDFRSGREIRVGPGRQSAIRHRPPPLRTILQRLSIVRRSNACSIRRGFARRRIRFPWEHGHLRILFCTALTCRFP